MNITRTQAGEVMTITIEGRGFAARYKRMGDNAQLKIEGKVPSRRVVREIVRELDR